MKKQIWIDIINPSHALFFKPIINYLKNDYNIIITIRNRGETTKLAEKFGLYGKIIGKDYENNLKKIVSMTNRTLFLNLNMKKFDYSISFENPMSIAVSKMKDVKSILSLDNDLKYKIKNNIFQSFESKIKLFADFIIIPKACEETFSQYDMNSKFITYNGFKEDVYIADFSPDLSLKEKLPFKEYIVIRGEALSSFYVNKNKSLIPQLFNYFSKENVNILFLPRDSSDLQYRETKNISILKEPLNGLDLIYYSSGVLTGSGTMAREGACMGKTAVSFFPSDVLLSVDQELVDRRKILHSRNPKEIVDYVISHMGNNFKLDLKGPKIVKSQFLKLITNIITEN